MNGFRHSCQYMFISDRDLSNIKQLIKVFLNEEIFNKNNLYNISQKKNTQSNCIYLSYKCQNNTSTCNSRDLIMRSFLFPIQIFYKLQVVLKLQNSSCYIQRNFQKKIYITKFHLKLKTITCTQTLFFQKQSDKDYSMIPK